MMTARFIAIEAIIEHGERIYDVVEEGRAVLDTYYGLANAIKSHEVEGQAAMNATLGRFWVRVEQDAPRTEARGLAATLHERLAELTARDICAGCPAASPCTGRDSLQDRERLALEGHCFAAYWSLCNLSRDVAVQIYAQHNGGRYVPPVVRFCTEQLAKRNTVLNTAFSASTSESAAEGTRDVLIAFCVSEFDYADYEQMLYGIFHECFVHALCGVRLDSGLAYLSESFHEGWMDYIAFLVLDRHLKRGQNLPHLVHANLDGFRSASTKAHEWRTDFRRPGCSSETRLNAFGRRAARAFVAFCSALCGQESGLDLAIGFSVMLNSSNISDETRGRLVSDASRRLVGQDNFARALMNETMVKALRAFERDRDPCVVIDGLGK